MRPDDEEVWADFVAELHRVAADGGYNPERLPRSVFLEFSSFGKRYAKRWGGWSACRRMAARGIKPWERQPPAEEQTPPSPPAPAAEGQLVTPADYAKDDHPFPIIPPGTRLKDTSTYVNGQWVKTEPIRLSPAELLEQALAKASEWIDDAPPPIPCPKVSDSDLLRVYAFGDMHHGMRAWGGDGGADWDIRQSEAIHREAITSLVECGPAASRALIVNVGDGMHANDNSNATPRSKHPLDLSARWAETLQSMFRLKIAMVDACLTKHASVGVEIVAGNHDPTSAFAVSAYLHAWYRNEPRVSVSLSAQAHRYHRFGRCLIGVAHGDKGKIADLGRVMSVDAAEDWGQTIHRMWLTGHTHHTERLEQHGCVVEILRTLAPNDHYSQGQGHRSGRDAMAFTFHRKWGEMEHDRRSAAYLMQRLQEAG